MNPGSFFNTIPISTNPHDTIGKDTLSGSGRRVNAVRSTWKYAAAVSVAIALVASYLAFSYRSQSIEKGKSVDELTAKNQQIAKDYDVVTQTLDKIQADRAIFEDRSFRKVTMTGTLNDRKALASVYWSESSHEVYLSIQNLQAIPKENQFQLWASVKGRMVDAGVFDLDFIGLRKMKDIAGAAAFAVTIEIRGGAENPTLNTIQVIGPIDKRKG